MKVKTIIECLQQVDGDLDVHVDIERVYNMCDDCKDSDCRIYGCRYNKDDGLKIVEERLMLFDLNNNYELIKVLDVNR